MPLRADSTLTAPRPAIRGGTDRIQVAVPEVEFWQKPVFITFLLVWLANVIISGFGIKLPADGLWVEGLLPVTALATTLLSQRRVLPWQNILAMAAIIGGFGYTVTAVCARTGLPFGPLAFLDADANPLFDAVPWWIPALWVVLIVNARGVARLTLFRWRTSRNFGLLVIGATCMLVVLLMLGLEPVVTQTKRYWVWTSGKSAIPWNWYGAPITNFLSWGICTLVLLIATVVWSINKRPVPVAPYFQPVAVWGLLTIWLGVSNWVEQRWAAVGVLSAQWLIIIALSAKSKGKPASAAYRTRPSNRV